MKEGKSMFACEQEDFLGKSTNEFEEVEMFCILMMILITQMSLS